jgi:Subtilase family.
MIPETGERIYSNDYFDLLFNFTGDLSVFDQFPDATVQLLSNVAVVHVPLQQITNNTIFQLGYQVIPTLSGLISQTSLEASGVNKIRSFPNFNLRGKGVLVGILDTGIDFTNPIFINADNTSKIALLWDQTLFGENYLTNTYYGTEYTKEQINQAIQSKNPYEIVPSKDEIGHGTMVAGIAAGNEVIDKGFSGVVPDAELVVVKLKLAKQNLKDFWGIPKNVICYQQNDIEYALEYLEQAANKLGRPMSICIAIGTAQGSHDNSMDFNYSVSNRSRNLNFAITIAAGNEGSSRRQ